MPTRIVPSAGMKVFFVRVSVLKNSSNAASSIFAMYLLGYQRGQRYRNKTLDTNMELFRGKHNSKYALGKSFLNISLPLLFFLL